jgi:hypothetical protein
MYDRHARSRPHKTRAGRRSRCIAGDAGQLPRCCRKPITAAYQYVRAGTALRGETPLSQQTSHAVEGVRVVGIDDTPDEGGN